MGSDLMGLHEAGGAPVPGQGLTQLGLQTLHLSGDGLQGALVALLLLQGLVQRLLLLTDLRGERERGAGLISWRHRRYYGRLEK